MSMFSWFPGKKSGTVRKSDQTPSRKSFAVTRAPAISPRKRRRIKRREQLFVVVRESLIRGGVLSTSYEFKVLTLDATGDTFLVLIDLALTAQSMSDEHLMEVESWIRDSAQGRHEMVVRAVYWRRKPVQTPAGVAFQGAAAQTKRPAVNPETVARPPVDNPQAGGRPQVVDRDEIEAFRRAIRKPSPAAAGVLSSEAVLLPLPESHSDFSALSETQRGKL